MVFDATVSEINEPDFEQNYWTTSEFGHIKGQDDKSSNMTEGRVMGFNRRDKVDANHAGDSITRISRTGYIVYLNTPMNY